MKIRTPLQKIGVKLNDDNMAIWQNLSVGEKLFYKFVIEHDSTLSSMFIGIFSAYVVNIVSNLAMWKIDNSSFAIVYLFNLFFASITLVLLMKLYPLHLLVEKRSATNADTVRVNKNFELLYQSERDIKIIVKKLKFSIIGLCATLLLCLAMSNGLFGLICNWIIKGIGEIYNV